MVKVYMLVGCPGSGKTWIANQLKAEYKYIPHDDYIKTGTDAYIRAIIKAAKVSDKPILIETPFSMSKIIEPLKTHGITPVNVFIVEDPKVVASRYLKREGKTIPVGHLSRQRTYMERMKESNGLGGSPLSIVSLLQKLAESK